MTACDGATTRGKLILHFENTGANSQSFKSGGKNAIGVASRGKNTNLLDEIGMGMRPGQCGMCWSMRYRGGRLATELCRGDISGLVGYGC